MKRSSFSMSMGLAAYLFAFSVASAQDTTPPESTPPETTPPATTEPPATTTPPVTAPPVEGTEGTAEVPSPIADTRSFFFGTPNEATAFASTGYSGVLRGGYVFLPGDFFSVGGEFILDAGLFYATGNEAPGTISVAIAAPIKLTFMDNDQMIIGMTARPGLGVTIVDVGTVRIENGVIVDSSVSSEALFALLFHLEGNVGFKINEDFIVGGGIDIPVTFLFGEVNGQLFPLLFGPAAEYQLTDELALHADFKIGPHIATGDGLSTTFGLKFTAGASYIF